MFKAIKRKYEFPIVCDVFGGYGFWEEDEVGIINDFGLNENMTKEQL